MEKPSGKPDRKAKDASWKDRLPRNENGIVLLLGGNPQIPKSGAARWIDVHGLEEFDEAVFAEWIRQATALPGWDGT